MKEFEKYKEIIIDWEPNKPWNLTSFERLNEQNVLYQIYCDSHIYGRGVLAYIGKTDRSFQNRLSEHEKSFFQYANNINYSIGIVKNSLVI